MIRWNSKIPSDKWNDWKKKFWSGKLPIIYLMILDVGLVLALTVYYHTTVHFYAYFISSIAVYGVFTDEVAHLYPLYPADDTLKQWLLKVLSGRTHDVYGMIIVIVAMAVTSLGLIQISIIALSIIQIMTFAAERFYH
jgi:hypothetical protein